MQSPYNTHRGGSSLFVFFKERIYFSGFSPHDLYIGQIQSLYFAGSGMHILTSGSRAVSASAGGVCILSSGAHPSAS